MSFFPILILECNICKYYNNIQVLDLEGIKEFECKYCGKRLIWEKRNKKDKKGKKDIITIYTNGCKFIGFGF